MVLHKSQFPSRYSLTTEKLILKKILVVYFMPSIDKPKLYEI